MCHNCRPINWTGNRVYRANEPSDSQVASMDELIRMYEHADYSWSIEASMDEYNVGDMVVVLTTDGASQSAWFGRDGRIIGNWQ